MAKRRVAAVAALVVLAAMTVFILGRGGNSGGAAASPTAPQVTAAVAITREHAPRKVYTGALSAVQSVELKPRVAGYIAEVSVPEGEFVRQGQRLFLIDPVPFQARLEAARAATREAQARLEFSA